MLPTIVRDILALVGVGATIAGVWIGIIAYRAAKRGERRILREIKRKTRPRYVIGQVVGWMALRPWLGGSPRPRRLTSNLLIRHFRLFGDQGGLGGVHVPRFQSRCPGDRHRSRLTFPRIRLALVRLSPLSRDPGRLDRSSRDLSQATIFPHDRTSHRGVGSR